MERAQKRRMVVDVKVLTLDQILAFDVENFGVEKDRIVSSLENFLTQTRESPELKGTILVAEIIPLCRNLLSWMQIFEDNMRELEVRLKGMDGVRVCFAEKAMTMLLDLSRNINYVKRILDNMGTQEQVLADQVKEALQYLVDAINPTPSQGLQFFVCYLSTLVDVVPFSLRSATTPLTTENMNKIKANLTLK